MGKGSSCCAQTGGEDSERAKSRRGLSARRADAGRKNRDLPRQGESVVQVRARRKGLVATLPSSNRSSHYRMPASDLKDWYEVLWISRLDTGYLDRSWR